MNLPTDLLEQARMLHGLETRRPKQASLRRAVSTAYYSLFHLFVDEATTMMFGGQLNRRKYRHVLGRGYSHTSMNSACRSFAGAMLPNSIAAVLGSFSIPPELQTVSSTFVQLQQKRHHADYNLARQFSKSEVALLLTDTQDAFDLWQGIRNDDTSRFFLMALPLWEQLKRS